MALEKHTRQLLVIIAEATLETHLIKEVMRLGARGYTVTEVKGGGSEGVREGAWDADRTVRMDVVCEPAVADTIAEYVLATYAPHYSMTLFFSEVQVVREQKF